MKRALILGVTGQDGSYLAEYLLELGYEVHGLHRRTSTSNLGRIQHLADRITLHRGDLSDPLSIHRVIASVNPQELYNEADQDHVGWSHSVPAYSVDVTAGAVARLLQSVLQIDRTIRVFQPVSATMFGRGRSPMDEHSLIDPQSPYAIAKTAAYHLARYYRHHHGLFVSTAILFNHDSIRRSEEYLLHKLAFSAVRIARGVQEVLTIGDPACIVDIGSASEFMTAAHSILQIEEPDDFVVGTGTGFEVEALAHRALIRAGVVEHPGRHIAHDRGFEVSPFAPRNLIANIRKAHRTFGFSPHTTAVTMLDRLVDYAAEVLAK